MKLLIIIPTFNEAQNIPLLIPEIFSELKNRGKSFAVLVVDDASPDGTAKKVRELQKKFANVFLLEREKKGGLASAYVAGFCWGLERGFDAFLEMDADFSHNPRYIEPLLQKIESGSDVAVGSRNVKGGAVQNWSVLRNLVSKGGSLYSRIVLGTGNSWGGGGKASPRPYGRIQLVEKIRLAKNRP